MKNLLSYCGLGDLRISASDKDLPVLYSIIFGSVLPECLKLKQAKNVD